MFRLRKAGIRNGVLLATAGVLLAVAAVLYWFRASGQDAAPADQYVGLYCPDCNYFFRVSDRQFEALWDKKQYQRGSGEKTLVFRCAKCGKMTAVRADQPPAANAPGKGGG